jgi:putative phage-type endonuclease
VDRAEWLKERRNGIGASEAAAVVGESSFSSPAELWALKCGFIEPELDNELLEAGRRQEAVIAQWLADKTKREIELEPPYQITWSKDVPFLFCTLDARDKRGPIVQLKNADAFMFKKWKEGAPCEYNIQVQQEMFCSGVHECTLAALVGGNRFFYYDIAYDAELYEGLILPELVAFWEMVQEQSSPPICGHPATGRMLRKLHPDDNGRAIALADDAEELYIKLMRCKQAEQEIKTLADGYKNKLAGMLGENTYGVTPRGLELTYATVEVPAHARNASKSRRLTGKWPRGMKPAIEAIDLSDDEA